MRKASVSGPKAGTSMVNQQLLHPVKTLGNFHDRGTGSYPNTAFEISLRSLALDCLADRISSSGIRPQIKAIKVPGS